MNYQSEIELLSKIDFDNLPKSAFGISPQKVIKEAILVLKSINDKESIDQEAINKIIQVHQDSDILTERLQGMAKADITLVYNTTLKILRKNILHQSEKVEEALRILDTTFKSENSSFRITGYDDQEIKGNVDGLRNLAVQLLKVSTGELSEFHEDWFGDARETDITKITLNYYDKTKVDHEPIATWKDGVYKFGCVAIVVVVAASCIVGLVEIGKWLIF